MKDRRLVTADTTNRSLLEVNYGIPSNSFAWHCAEIQAHISPLKALLDIKGPRVTNTCMIVPAPSFKRIYSPVFFSSY